MTTWSGGYVTDIDYLANYYAEQSPYLLAASCLVAGFEPGFSGTAPGLHYLELGCGRGTNALVQAAANPDWRVTAIDFMPAAIAEARRLAAAAGLTNVQFIEADLAEFADTPEAAALPEVDVVSLHGVWSWVAPAVRQGIVRLLARRLRAGGMVHVSYNVLPGWQGALAMQRLLREGGRRLAGRSDRQVQAGCQLVADLAAAGARQLETEVARELVPKLAGMPAAYLAHEYMNEAWSPCYQAELEEALGPAKLDFVACARLPENFDALMMTEAQRAVLERFDDRPMRELIKDSCVNRVLRHDIYIRGARRLPRPAQDAALSAMHVALTVRPEDFVFQIEMPAGLATLAPAHYRPMVEALAQGPLPVGALAGLPGQAEGSVNPAETLAMLVGTGQAVLLARPDAAPADAARRLNAALARSKVRLDSLSAAAVGASARIGAGITCRSIELFLIDRIGAAGGVVDPGVWALELGPGLAAEGLAALSATFEKVLEDRLAIWQAAGLV